MAREVIAPVRRCCGSPPLCPRTRRRCCKGSYLCGCAAPVVGSSLSMWTADKSRTAATEERVNITREQAIFMAESREES